MDNKKILLDHGSGGKVSHSLTKDLLLPVFGNPILNRLDDGAVFDVKAGQAAFSTDTYVVDPIFFRGGNIGDLAINGTVNDLAMCGARPRYLSVGLILEEGFTMADLKVIVETMGRAVRKAGVAVVTGDTKVVPKGAADKIFINTAGVGFVPAGINVASDQARPGDVIILSGTMADHGATVLTQREGLTFEAQVASDSAALNHMVAGILEVCPQTRVLRDPTRGGVGTALNEIARQSGVEISIHEDKLPVRPAVAGICELLGLDPVYVANEGKLLAFVPADDADRVLAAISADEFGKEACVIGEVTEGGVGKVFMQTRIGGSRIVDMLTGEQLPRIC